MVNILHLYDLYLPQTMNWAWRRMRSVPHVNNWVAAPWMLQNAYRSPEITFFPHPVQRSINWFPESEQAAAWFSTNLIRVEKRWPVYRKYLQNLLHKSRPDILHAHFGPVACHYLPLAKRLDIPLVASFYGFDFQRVPFEKPAYRDKYSALFDQAAAIITTGERSVAWLVAQGCAAGKIIPVPLGIVPDEFPFVLREKKRETLRMVQVATITDKKGHLDALEALKLVLPECPNIQYVIAGERQDGVLYRQLVQYIRDNGLTQQVQLLDALPHTGLQVFLQAFDLFIHPSRMAVNRDCEGAPVVILEAQASGLPVVSTFHADIPLQVIDGKTGLLAPERNPVELARLIKRFYFMENIEYQQFARAARSHVEQGFALDSSGEMLSRLYTDILHRRF